MTAMKKPAAAAVLAAGEEAEVQDPSGATAESVAPPGVGVEYVGGQRHYTAWAQIPGTGRRVLGPSRPSSDRAWADAALIGQLASMAWAGEGIAGRWRRGEIGDRDAASELQKAPSEMLQGASSRPRGRAWKADERDEEEAEVLKKPATAEGTGRGRSMLKRPAGRDGGGSLAKKPAQCEEEDA
mmetsp:Transcript_71776/g.166010  ORF Transcript_71776/g.166010 Transcript_71776/m.166010 type:complete len:184 (+) Transcript_71776:45-596(+)|eukprot:CAMPEP_0171075672 /NCGR_PEP_ID=MMETSP0766_2-20121228/12928_1 /TAXON_ID=439317 /ORGANISM="Gambierdiscus australes, Strain CAWD 149" /LENGTH=183 /DNA_ID=CAMNT_0011532569 /DNA_START=19 /DNA_END=570 /DNA_ORIENTATION=+